MSLKHVNNQKEFGRSMSILFRNNEHDFWCYHLWMLFVCRKSKLYQGSQCYHVHILKTYRLYSQIKAEYLVYQLLLKTFLHTLYFWTDQRKITIIFWMDFFSPSIGKNYDLNMKLKVFSNNFKNLLFYVIYTNNIWLK